MSEEKMSAATKKAKEAVEDLKDFAKGNDVAITLTSGDKKVTIDGTKAGSSETRVGDAGARSVPEPNKSFLTNPTPVGSDAWHEDKDKAYKEALSAQRRAVLEESRKHLEDGCVGLAGSAKSIKFDRPHSIIDEKTGVSLAGKLSITIQPSFNSLAPMAMAQYAGVMQRFVGDAASFVDQVAQDFDMMLRPEKVSVSFDHTSYGSKITAKAERKVPTED